MSFNKGSFGIAPTLRTNIDNIVIGSIVAKHFPIVSQESAAHNGRAAAAYILSKSGLSKCRVIPFRPILLPTKVLDRILYNMHIPEIKYSEKGFIIIDFFLKSICVILLTLIVRKMRR